MTSGVEAFVDTNLLLTATSPARPAYARVLARLEAGFAERSFTFSGQVLREYLSVATRPVAMNGLGLTQAEAVGNSRQFLDRARFVEENAVTRDALLRLLDEVPCSGKQVHDANIVATMLTHRIARLLTLNPADFERFQGWIHVEAA